MIVLADNDIIHKLACCDLLDELLVLLDSPPNSVMVLSSMKYVVGSKLKSNIAAGANLKRFLKQVSVIPEASPLLLQQFMLSNIDAGEAQMIAVLVETSSISRFVTGDKRALIAISNLASSHQKLDLRLAETRTDCLESIVLGLIERFGYSAINAKISPAVAVDKALKACFGETRTESHARQGLESYIADLQRQAPFVARH
jgi:hypothetical protein